MESRNSRVRVVAMLARHGDSESFLLLMLTKNWLSGFGFHIFSHIFYFLWGVETANQLDLCHIGLSLSTKGYFDVVTPGIGGSWVPELDDGTIDRSPLIFQTLLHCQQWKSPWVSHENQPIETPEFYQKHAWPCSNLEASKTSSAALCHGCLEQHPTITIIGNL